MRVPQIGVSLMSLKIRVHSRGVPLVRVPLKRVPSIIVPLIGVLQWELISSNEFRDESSYKERFSNKSSSKRSSSNESFSNGSWVPLMSLEMGVPPIGSSFGFPLAT